MPSQSEGRIVDVLVLDSPFANFRGMVHDVIHSQYKVCGCCINLALSGVLKDCKKKIGKDLTLIKPVEAVPHIEVPCFYMVGKQDIIARPEKVKELFLRTKSLDKEYHTFEGEHPSHRDKYILKKAILFVLGTFDRLRLGAARGTIPKPKLDSKKERQKYNKRLCYEHEIESFRDAPAREPKPKELVKPKVLASDVETEHLRLSQGDLPGGPQGGSSKPMEPKAGLDDMSNNLDQVRQMQQETPAKQGLALSFSENAPPLQMKKEGPSLGSIPEQPKLLTPEGTQPPTGNSSPK